MTKAIVATAVGTVLAGLILQLSGLLPKVVSWVWGVASWIVGTLVSSHGIPGWAILALGLLALFGVITFSMMVIEALRDGQEQPIEEQPFFINYTEDEIDGVIWRWKWADGSTLIFGAFVRRVTRSWCTPKAWVRPVLSVNAALQVAGVLGAEDVAELSQA